MKISTSLLTMVLLGGGVLLGGCSVDGSASDEASASDDEALSALNHWTSCSYGQTIDSFSGVPVKCDEPNGHGVYQCVEYANRYVSEVLHKPEIHANATDMCDVAAQEGYEVFNESGTWGHRSSGHKPVKGDLLIWGGGSAGYGHVAVVSNPGASAIEYVQQNWGWYQGGHWGQVSHSETPWYGSFFGGTGASGSSNHYAKCWIHAPGAASAPPPPPPSSSSCQVGGLYCGGDDLSGDSNTLYRCEASGPQVVEHCAYGCRVNSGTDDSCKASSSPCVVGGLYCGGDKIVGDSSTLYRCEANNAVQVVEHCASGCAVHSGSNDGCK